MSSGSETNKIDEGANFLKDLPLVWQAFAVRALLLLNIPDHLKDGKKSAKQLAELTSSKEEYLSRLLRAVSSAPRKILNEDSEGFYSNTEAAKMLITSPLSPKWFWLHLTDEACILPYMNLAESIKQGRSSFEIVFGESIFDYLLKHPEPQMHFNNAMDSNPNNFLIAKYEGFGKMESLVDVGSSQGRYLTHIMGAYPNIKKGYLFDLPHVVPSQAPRPDIEITKGSFFELDHFPKGADAYIMKHILHDWDDQNSIKILKNCAQAMKGDSRVLVCDHVIPGPGDDSVAFGKYLDLAMMACCNGKERTKAQWEFLFSESG